MITRRAEFVGEVTLSSARGLYYADWHECRAPPAGTIWLFTEKRRK